MTGINSMELHALALVLYHMNMSQSLILRDFASFLQSFRANKSDQEHGVLLAVVGLFTE